MSSNHENDLNARMQAIPSVDELIGSEELRELAASAGPERLAELVRLELARFRLKIRAAASDTADGDLPQLREVLRERAVAGVLTAWEAESRRRLIKVINATGVVIHTNLGRAPLSKEAKLAIARASDYCNVEYDLATGARGRRGSAAEELIARLVGAEDALIVNNCAAAALLVLTALARGGSVIVSRGELVEIGGDFRIPDVLTQSGCNLKEVGTTNRTKVGDFEKAISSDTKMIMRVHPSNYRIVGFTATPTTEELSSLAKKRDVIFFEDAGSGALHDLAPLGIRDEPVITASIATGVDVVAFSGDKLLGGPQAGIIVGKGDLIENIRKHPLYRALRAGKLVYAAMEATLSSYERGTQKSDIPVVRMLSMSAEDLEGRANVFCKALLESLSDPDASIVQTVTGNSAVGGGASPDFQPRSTLIKIASKMLSATEIQARLRSGEKPVIARIEDDAVLLDLRTVSENEEPDLLRAAVEALATEP